MEPMPLYWARDGSARELPPYPEYFQKWAADGTPLDEPYRSILKRVEEALSLRVKQMFVRSQNDNLILEVEYESGRRDIVRTPNPDVLEETGGGAVQTIVREAELLRWLKANSELPVPTIRAILKSQQDGVLPVVVMEKMPGEMVLNVIGKATLAYSVKERLMRSFAEFQVQLFRLEVPQRIGTARCEDLAISVDSEEDGMASLEEYIDALLKRHERELEHIEDISARESCTRILARLKRELPNLYTRLAPPSRRRCVLKHDDLNPQNILMDDEGYITGVVDWDLQVVLPAALAVSYPSFIRYDGVHHPEYAREPYPGMEIWWFVSPDDSRRLRELYTQIARELDEEYYDALVNGEVLRQVAEWLAGSPDYVLTERWMETAFPSA
ncbi:kinase-like protein [Trametes sanguinea]|nr:kinase-like protein [Trametes sanguinea]